MGSSQSRGDSWKQRQPGRPFRLISFHEEQLQPESISQEQQPIRVVRGSHTFRDRDAPAIITIWALAALWTLNMLLLLAVRWTEGGRGRPKPDLGRSRRTSRFCPSLIATAALSALKLSSMAPLRSPVGRSVGRSVGPGPASASICKRALGDGGGGGNVSCWSHQKI